MIQRSEGELNTIIDDWHDGAYPDHVRLHEAMGMTMEEYIFWTDRNVLPEEGTKCPNCGRPFNQVGLDYTEYKDVYICYTCSVQVKKEFIRQDTACDDCKRKDRIIASLLEEAGGCDTCSEPQGYCATECPYTLAVIAAEREIPVDQEGLCN